MTLRGVSRMLSIRRLSLASAGLVLAPLAAHAQVPTGWQAVTDGSGEYTVSADVARRDGGQGYARASIKANVASPRGSAMRAEGVRGDARTEPGSRCLSRQACAPHWLPQDNWSQ